jgi:hypothetical protein
MTAAIFEAFPSLKTERYRWQRSCMRSRRSSS